LPDLRVACGREGEEVKREKQERETNLNIPDRLRSSKALLLRGTGRKYTLPRRRGALVVPSRSVVLPSLSLTIGGKKVSLPWT
jgi:hypothetical protein